MGEKSFTLTMNQKKIKKRLSKVEVEVGEVNKKCYANEDVMRRR